MKEIKLLNPVSPVWNEVISDQEYALTAEAKSPISIIVRSADMHSYELEKGVLKVLGINEFLKVPVSKMSGGMKKRLSIGCAVADRPVGIDVESTERKISDALIRHTMSPQEQEEMEGDPVRFFHLWTQKEALVKLRGTGLQDNLHDLLLPHNTTDVEFRTEDHSDRGYVISTAILKT